MRPHVVLHARPRRRRDVSRARQRGRRDDRVPAADQAREAGRHRPGRAPPRAASGDPSRCPTRTRSTSTASTCPAGATYGSWSTHQGSRHPAARRQRQPDPRAAHAASSSSASSRPAPTTWPSPRASTRPATGSASSSAQVTQTVITADGKSTAKVKPGAVVQIETTTTPAPGAGTTRVQADFFDVATRDLGVPQVVGRPGRLDDPVRAGRRRPLARPGDLPRHADRKPEPLRLRERRRRLALKAVTSGPPADAGRAARRSLPRRGRVEVDVDRRRRRARSRLAGTSSLDLVAEGARAPRPPCPRR